MIYDCLAHTYPNIEQRRRLAYAIMCLANDTWSMISLGFPMTRLETAHHIAKQLISALATEPKPIADNR